MTRKLIALSIGSAPEQHELGFGGEHLAEALVRLARQLLRNPDPACDLAYGGDLRSGGFTELLMRLVRAENDDGQPDARPRRSRDTRRLVNFLPWPKYGGLTPDLHAQYLGVARFVRVPPPFELPADVARGEAGDAIREGLALAAMRKAMADGGACDVDDKEVPPADARIVLGGKVTGYGGFMPGILEEVAFALTGFTRTGAQRALFVLGGFGGIAAELARSLLAGAPTPACTLAWQLRQSDLLRARVAALAVPSLQQAARTFHPEERYRELAELCANGVHALVAKNGLSRDDNETLLRTSDVTEVLRVLWHAPVFRP